MPMTRKIRTDANRHRLSRREPRKISISGLIIYLVQPLCSICGVQTSLRPKLVFAFLCICDIKLCVI
jgi:hypothetical protein